jgi:drug/metabolite transporter (DMT)-like permease
VAVERRVGTTTLVVSSSQQTPPPTVETMEVKATVGKVSPSRLIGWRRRGDSHSASAATWALSELNRRAVIRGSVLGALLGLGFVLCTVGMQTASVLISAFVIGTTVVFAPLIAWIWLGRRLTTRAAAGVSRFVGLAMITVCGFAVGPELC